MVNNKHYEFIIIIYNIMPKYLCNNVVYFIFNFQSTSKDIANSLKDLNEVEETLNRIQAHKGVQGNTK